VVGQTASLGSRGGHAAPFERAAYRAYADLGQSVQRSRGSIAGEKRRPLPATRYGQDERSPGAPTAGLERRDYRDYENRNLARHKGR
jgi:hypothetical protein